MRISPIILPLAAFALVPSVALAADNDSKPAASEKQPAAFIPFANRGGVWDWHGEGQSTVYFQDRHKRWYKAELLTPCVDLPWVQFIGLDTGPSDRLDKWSQIYVKGQRYPFKSFERYTGELPWKKKPKAD